MEKSLPAIPAKRYFTIGEVGDLCGVKPHVLRYWEQEFTQLRPMKRRGNRRYYQHHEVLMIRRIRDLLYDQGFTISGARNKLQELVAEERERRRNGELMLDGVDDFGGGEGESSFGESAFAYDQLSAEEMALVDGGGEHDENFSHASERANERMQLLRRELLEIRELLGAPA
jgi:DNA-binding transcriptional MerR regulator